ncbi:DUF7168 domain-containing protein, partial [Paenirhodobacter enshiensis]|uniref:DUF7168 domain-containing protein n=1 Tax=Paenirhodobacter enshiensis TaxID=1105367 RepID=UPI0005681011
ADQASSEAEAAAAARRAAKIIAEHEVTEAELIERGSSSITEGEFNAGRRSQHPALDAATPGITRLTETQPLFSEGTIFWVGQPEDVEFALYLCELVQGASERAYRGYWQKTMGSAPSSTYRRSFMIGFGEGIADRMYDLAYERDRARHRQRTTGTSVAVVKGQLIANYMESTYPSIKSRREGRKKTLNSSALRHGIAASLGVNLNRPVSSEDEAEHIGGAA